MPLSMETTNLTKTRNSQNDRRSFWVSVAFHGILGLCCMIPMTQQMALLPGMSSQQPIVQVKAITAAEVPQQVSSIRAKERAAREAERKRQAAIEAAKQRQIQQARLKKQQAIARQKAAQEKALALARQKAAQQQAAKAKALALAQKQQAQEKKAKQLAELDALAKQAEQLQQQQHLQQLQQEQQHLKQVALNQGVINQYRQRIAQSIGSYWLVSRDVNKALSCQFLIQLAPGGVVLDVKLLKSSGNAAFDRSAEVAVYKASPLPVPKDAAQFGPFRQFSLIVSPKTVMIRSPST